MSKKEQESKSSYYIKMETSWESEYPSISSLQEVEDFFHEIGIKRRFQEMLDEQINHVHFKNQKGRVLDFGCDNGIMLNYFTKYDLELYGVDINGKSIKEGRRLFPDFNLVKSYNIEIPFKDNYFDLLFVSGVLKHIRHEDRKDVYEEFNRVSRYILVFELNSEKDSIEKMGSFNFYHSNFKEELVHFFNSVHMIEIGAYIFGLYKME